MDFVFASSIQFLEFLVCGWISLNADHLRLDHQAFHATKRPVNCNELVQEALRIETSTIDAVKIIAFFRPLSTPAYPMIECCHDALVLRTLQSDTERLAELRDRLRTERRRADAAEASRRRRRETFDEIMFLNENRAMAEKVSASGAVSSLSLQSKRVKLEEKRLRQNEERLLIDTWAQDWSRPVYLVPDYKPLPDAANEEAHLREEKERRIQSFMNLREADILARQTRKAIATMGKYAQSKVNELNHENGLRSLVTGP
jgi:hypothetical protein